MKHNFLFLFEQCGFWCFQSNRNFIVRHKIQQRCCVLKSKPHFSFLICYISFCSIALFLSWSQRCHRVLYVFFSNMVIWSWRKRQIVYIFFLVRFSILLLFTLWAAWFERRSLFTFSTTSYKIVLATHNSCLLFNL